MPDQDELEIRQDLLSDRLPTKRKLEITSDSSRIKSQLISGRNLDDPSFDSSAWEMYSVIDVDDLLIEDLSLSNTG